MPLVTRQYGPNAKNTKLSNFDMDSNLYYLQELGVSGFSYSNGIIEISNPTGGTKDVTINIVTGFTYDNLNTFTITDNYNNNFSATINTVTGLTVNGTISATTYQNLPPASFTGGTVSGTTTFTNGLTANTISATTYYNVSPNFQYEIHVSQVDGNDSTGDGSLLNPVASITKALTLITGQRRTIVIHPGSYTESPSITTQYTVLTTYEPLGGNTAIVGTVSTSVGCTIAGLTIQNLTITTGTGVGVPNIINCNISGTLTKSGNAAFTDIHNCNIDTACNITGTGLVTINDGNPNFVTVNNAGANVIIKNAMSCVSPSVTAGTLNITESIVIAAVTNAVTSSAGSVITLGNSQFLTSALNNVAPVSLSGFYSIFNCVFDKPNSTLVTLSGTGGPTNSIDYFQYINADKFITQGGTSSQYVMGNGSLSNGFTGGTVSGSTIFTNGLTATTISATTYQNLPIDPDTFVTGFTYGNNVFTIEQKNGQPNLTALINSVTGWTVNGVLTVTGDTSVEKLTANTVKVLDTSGTPDQAASFNSGGRLVAGLGQTTYATYGDSSLTAPTLNIYTLIPNLTQTISVPSNCSVFITTTGGVGTSNNNSNTATVDIAIFIDGALLPSGGFSRINSVNPNAINNGFTNETWAVSTIQTLSAGNHTIDVRVNPRSITGGNIVVSGPINNVRQGELYITIIKN